MHTLMDLRSFLACTVLLSVTVVGYTPWLRKFTLIRLSNATNAFGHRLFRQLTAREYGNIFICPFSASVFLSILYQASKGGTEKELKSALGYTSIPIEKEIIKEVLYLYIKEILQSSNPRTYTFRAPGTFLVNNDDCLLESFDRFVDALYLKSVTVVDFSKTSDTVDAVNDFVAAQTDERIMKIISYINPLADLIIIDTAYIKGRWMHRFSQKDTYVEDFYNYGTDPEKIYMMRMTHKLNYHKNDKRSILELPFRDGNASMVILLPNDFEGIHHMEDEFLPGVFEYSIAHLNLTEVQVYLPKFRLEYGINFVDSLKAMDINQLFRKDEVDLSGMLIRPSLTVGDFRHKAVIGINELGVEISAIKNTNSKFYRSVPEGTPHFKVDHPFLLAIFDRRINMILFMGRILKL